jgi:DNA-binding LytR/AlgR family response regulator
MSKKLKISKLLNRIMLINCKNDLFSNIDDIVFIKSDDVYVNVYNPQETELILGSLRNIIKELPEYFIRCHQSYIINIKKLITINKCEPGKYTAIMDNKISVPLTCEAYKKIQAVFDLQDKYEVLHNDTVVLHKPA